MLGMVETDTLTEAGEQARGWQLALENTCERLKYLYHSAQHTDITIVLPEYTEIFKVHKLVLIMSSPVFEAMLTGPMAVKEELTLHGDTPRAMQKILDYMYMNYMDLESVDLALEVYALAHKYQLDFAAKICSEYIVSYLDEEDTLLALEASLLYDDTALKERCYEVRDEKPDEVMAGSCVAKLRKETLRFVLQMEDLEVSSERVLFDAIMVWAKANVKIQGEESIGSTCKNEIKDLLKEVRFLTMSCEEFVDNVFAANVFSHTECFHILSAIRGIGVSAILEDIPISPIAFQRKMNLLKADMGLVTKCDQTEDFEKSENYTVLTNIVPSKNIKVFQIESDFPGLEMTVCYRNGYWKTSYFNHRVSSFKDPIVMYRSCEYHIEVSFPRDTKVQCTSQEERLYTCKVGDVSLRYQNRYNMNIKIYFQESS